MNCTQKQVMTVKNIISAILDYALMGGRPIRIVAYFKYLIRGIFFNALFLFDNDTDQLILRKKYLKIQFVLYKLRNNCRPTVSLSQIQIRGDRFSIIHSYSSSLSSVYPVFVSEVTHN